VGVVLRTIDLGTAVNGIDLAMDQCTLFFTSGAELRRYDICRNQSLGIFAPLPDAGRTLRILVDGSILAMTLQGIVHVSSSGSELQTYPFGFALALDVDGRSFWSGNGSDIYKIDIATGDTLLGPVDASNTVDAISVAGEPRAAVSPAAIAAIPALSMALLIAMVGVLGAIACIQISR
jgi:hypothetical protein